VFGLVWFGLVWFGNCGLVWLGLRSTTARQNAEQERSTLFASGFLFASACRAGCRLQPGGQRLTRDVWALVDHRRTSGVGWSGVEVREGVTGPVSSHPSKTKFCVVHGMAMIRGIRGYLSASVVLKNSILVPCSKGGEHPNTLINDFHAAQINIVR
jgi:hypothetical protein